MHRYKWYVIIFLVLLVIAQPSLTKWFSISDTSVNFVLFFIMLSAFGRKRTDALIAAFSIGIFYDLLYSPWFGRMAIVLLLAVLSVIAVGKIVYKENMPVLTIYFLISTFLLENIKTLLEVGPRLYYNNFLFIQGGLVKISFYSAVLAAAFGIIFYIRSIIKDKRLGARKSSVL